MPALFGGESERPITVERSRAWVDWTVLSCEIEFASRSITSGGAVIEACSTQGSGAGVAAADAKVFKMLG